MRLSTLFTTTICVLFITLQTTNTVRANAISPAECADFVQRHVPLAEREYFRAGMCISVTLGQMLLETNFGSSELATNANNYFGIKSKDANAPVYLMQDDEPQKSKFCIYSSVEESFMARTAFLNQPRYANLHKLRRDDYKGWAYELQRAGYATDPRYAAKLIAIIEKYRLYEYDQPNAFVTDEANTMNNNTELYADNANENNTDSTLDGLVKNGQPSKPTITTITKPDGTTTTITPATKPAIVPAAKPRATPAPRPNVGTPSTPPAGGTNNRIHYTRSYQGGN